MEDSMYKKMPSSNVSVGKYSCRRIGTFYTDPENGVQNLKPTSYRNMPVCYSVKKTQKGIEIGVYLANTYATNASVAKESINVICEFIKP